MYNILFLLSSEQSPKNYNCSEDKRIIGLKKYYSRITCQKLKMVLRKIARTVKKIKKIKKIQNNIKKFQIILNVQNKIKKT